MLRAAAFDPTSGEGDRPADRLTHEQSARLRLRDFAHTRLELTAPARVTTSARGGEHVLLLVHHGHVELRAPGLAGKLRLAPGEVALLGRASGWELEYDEIDRPLECLEMALAPRLVPQPPRPRAAESCSAELSFVALGFENEATLDLLEQLPPVLTAELRSSTLTALLAGAASFDTGLYQCPTIFTRALEIVLVELLHRCPASAWRRAPGSPPIRKAIELMRTNLATPWHVGTLAARVGMSRSAFAARFTLEMGEPPLRYLADLRLRDAAARLAGAEAPLKSIASAVGYESMPSFCKAFRSRFGVAPGAYRTQARSRG